MNHRMSVPEILERKRRRDRMTKLLLLALTLIVIVTIIAMIKPMRLVPACHEDVVLIGYGDFENGQWSNYSCGPAIDDFAEWSTNSY